MKKEWRSIRLNRVVAVMFWGVGLGGVHVTHAEEVPVGYIVNKANLSLADNQTFDGHNLGAMITPVMRKLVENGLTLKLASNKPMVLSPKLLAATEKHSGAVKFDKATRRISGYVAGIPFPHLSEKDPDIAEKIVWNHFYAYPLLSDVMIESTTVYSIDATRGLERTFELVNTQLKLSHRDSLEPVAPKALGDGGIFRKVLIFNLAPLDVAGTGAYIQRYDDGRVDDSWAYIKSIRRVRRISGGTWMDPIPGTDILNDDSGCLDSFPVWYPKFKLVGKQWVLGVMHGVLQEAPGGGHYPISKQIDTKNSPYWNVINQPWEPREVYVIDAFPPEGHPYSRKRIYYDEQSQTTLMCDFYDKKGQLWKFFEIPYTNIPMSDGQPGNVTPYVWAVDFQRMHSTYIDLTYYNQNESRADPNDWSSDTLANPDKFTAQGLTKRFGAPKWNYW